MATSVDDYSQRLRTVELAAQSAGDRIRSHEDICAERYRAINENIGAMRSILVKAAGLMITGMAGILVKLVFFA